MAGLPDLPGDLAGDLDVDLHQRRGELRSLLGQL
jgi:hypothetical protein